MKPVYQTIFYDPAEPPRGNCFAACVASLLEIPLEDVPDFCAFKNWVPKFLRFLRRRGYRRVAFLTFCDEPFPVDLGAGIDGLFIAVAEVPGGVLHAVIVNAHGNVVHDPHPEELGGAGISRLVEMHVIERVA